ncbi:hypothetical protein B0F90DRAFT_1666848 [Multifurca ochricompacta]|uniref:SP-RING-type domain-containing protein n=1 Tax=Multifurca ochricompacta TaxID=376703 RepID=A0AAD4M6W8_9AGAM|nr:hypothetical protein B0F90DRAFT_1666848 [Multifurca ochricompacta]
MPRYRRRVVDAMSDHIEDDEETQRQDVDAVDVDEDEDLQPRPLRRTRSSVVQGGSLKEGVVRNVSEIERDDGQDGIPVFHENEFGNKPLNRSEGQKLQGIASDWNMIQTNLKESAFSLLTEVSTAVAEYADEGTAQKELDRLDALMREVIDIDVEIRSHEQTLRGLHQQVVGGSEIEVQHPKEAMPPVVEFLPQEEGDHSDDDEDDIQVGGVLQDFNCPITLTPLVDPQTSTICQHTFSAEAIKQVLGLNRFTKKKCPASGCNQMICLNDLKPNKELERRVKAHERRARRREEDHDVEEIVE